MEGNIDKFLIFNIEFCSFRRLLFVPPITIYMYVYLKGRKLVLIFELHDKIKILLFYIFLEYYVH